MLLLKYLTVVILLSSWVCAQDARWPDFRGPTRDGHAPSADVPLRWSETENVRWKTPLPGRGWSSPVIWSGQVWMTYALPKGKEMGVVAVDLETGHKIHDRILFKNDSPQKVNALNSYASPTAAIEDGRVYVHFGSYGTACLDTKSGKTLWERRDLPCDHSQGPGSSPILFEDMLILTMDGLDVQYVVALDKKTGANRWKTDRTAKFPKDPELAKAYGTPIIIDVDGKQRLISPGAQATYGYDPHTGKEIWRLLLSGFSNCSRPIFHEGVLYLNTGFMRPQLVAVSPSGTGDVTDKNVIKWTAKRSVPTMPSPLFVEGSIYMVNDGGVVTCLDAKTGKPRWKERAGGEQCASPLYAGGRLYFFDREGRTIVVAPGSTYQELAVNELESGFMASPAVVGNALILRTKKHLYRIETKQN